MEEAQRILMMKTIYEQYADLLGAFQAASSRLKQTTEIIQRVGYALANGAFRFVDSDVSLSTDSLAIDQELTTLRTDKWPLAGDIIVTQKALCNARARLLNFYNSLPATERAAMKSLPPGVQKGKSGDRRK